MNEYAESNRDPSQLVRAAGFLLFCRPDQRFLLMRHRNRWDLPKGHAEPGESFLETALRETEEETGIAREQIVVEPDFQFDLTYPVTYKRTGDAVFTKQLRIFLGWLDRQPPLKLTEHLSANWFDWNPPHRIQETTIDPLLAEVDSHFARR